MDMDFFEFLNLDHVRSAVQRKGQYGNYIQLTFTDGETANISEYSFEHILTQKYPVIPATPGYFFRYHLTDMKDIGKGDWDYEIVGCTLKEIEPIIGWKLDKDEGLTVPVTTRMAYLLDYEEHSEGVYSILCPSGSIRSWRGTTYEDHEDWLKAILIEENVEPARMRKKIKEEKVDDIS